MSRTIQRIACSKCRRRNDPWRNFCGACGGALAGACKPCGAINQPSDKFCGGCARDLTAAPLPVKAPRLPPPAIPKAATHTIPITLLDESVMSETSS